MKLFTSIGPNPRVLRMFMIERGVDIPSVDIDIMGGENLGEEYRNLNPAAQSPCLQLDNGDVISEITAICNYLDEVSPGASLIGDTPEERAVTRMWSRRLDFKILEPMSIAFRSSEGLPIFQDRCHVLPDAADELKATVRENWEWINEHMGDGDFLCGDRFTLADMQMFCFAEFGTAVGQPVPEGLAKIEAWRERVSQRPSVMGSFHPSEVG